MRILILMMLLPFVPGEVINLKDITVTDGSLSCKCNFKMVFNTVVDLKKSKITCEKKKSMIISEHNIPTDTGSVISMSFIVMKNGKTKLTKATLQPPPPTTVPCTPGYTQVCSAAADADQDQMTEVCPATADRQTTTAGSGECSCLPTRGVEQDLASGVSPLGSSHQGCVWVPTERMFRSSPPLEVNMTEMADKWKINQFVSSLTGINQVEMKQALIDSMTQEMENEVALKRGGHLSRFIRSSEQSDAIAHNYMIMRSLQIAAENVSDSLNRQTGSSDSFQKTCKELKANLTREAECPTETCTPSDPYRTISGCCNNIGQRFLGSAARAFARLLPADYSNKVDLPRGGMDPSDLPSPRLISTTVHGVPVNGQLPPISLMVFQFGQFLDHDLTLTPESELDCCNPEVLEMDNQNPQSLRRCFNINATNDLFYSGKTDCLPLTRSDPTCTTEIREQFNLNTAFIDASMVYGSDTNTSIKLRGTNGTLLTHEGPTLPTLPSRKQSGFDSSHGEHPEDLVSGDIRTIEQPALASMHSLFLSEHNQIVRLLKEKNDKLDDEELYQTARQVVGAEIQNIVFSEFLPVVLGKDIMTKFNLNLPEDKKGDTKYDPAVDPTIDNVFATVAFRFGHSLIPNMFLPSTNPIRSSNRCQLKENFNTFEEFVIGDDTSGKAWHNMLKGIIKQPSPAMDAFVVSTARDFLFCNDCSIPGGFGQDLIARNIQKERDHGIPSYVKFREYCNLTVPTSWSSPLSEINPENWKNLQKVYANVEDIDAFTGGLSEEAVNGSLVGPTFACLIATQFSKTMSGDRYFFTHSHTHSSEKGLPPSVKAAIRNRNLGDILCTNTDAVSTAASVMKISDSNKETPCSDRDGLGKIIEEVLKVGMPDSFLLVGGVVGRGVTPSSEFIGLPSNSASEFPLPEKAYSLFSVVTPTQAMLCSREEDRTCYTFNTGTNQWQNSSQFNQQRKKSGVVTLASGPYVLGGVYRWKSSEVWRNGVWIDGPNIPANVGITCAIAYNSFTLVISLYYYQDKTTVWSYNEDTSQWKQWPSLPGPRSGAACLKLSDGSVLMAGGSFPGRIVFSSALKINETHITEAGNMKRARAGPRMVYMSEKIYLIGGYTSIGDSLTSIEEYNQEEDVWTISDMELEHGRRSFSLIPTFLLF